MSRNTIKCLDHGYVKILNLSSAIPRHLLEFDETKDNKVQVFEHQFNARDIDPAKIARISFNNFEQERPEEVDMKLVKYLLSNRHNTPIEMTEVWLEMKLPIFVARQFVRHRTACINEVSARYSTLPAEWYIPEIVGGKSTNGAKQGQEDNLEPWIQDWFKTALNADCVSGYRQYSEALRKDVAPEHARMFLHVNHYTHWVWKQDLSNMMHFLRLRMHEHAQIEARIYANAIYTLLERHLPLTMQYFKENL